MLPTQRQLAWRTFAQSWFHCDLCADVRGLIFNLVFKDDTEYNQALLGRLIRPATASVEIMALAVQKNRWCYRLIAHRAPLALQLWITDRWGYMIRYMQSYGIDPKVIDAALDNHPSSLRWIHKQQTTEMAWKVLRIDVKYLRLVKRRTPEMCKYAWFNTRGADADWVAHYIPRKWRAHICEPVAKVEWIIRNLYGSTCPFCNELLAFRGTACYRCPYVRQERCAFKCQHPEHPNADERFTQGVNQVCLKCHLAGLKPEQLNKFL